MQGGPLSDETAYREMRLIRTFEETLLRLFSEGALAGTTHTYSGQEADAVGVLHHLGPRDSVFSSHRCHGHFLVRTGDVEGLLAELMGLESGVCSGKGGSQHLCRDRFYTNGIQGSIVPLAVGTALAHRERKTGGISCVFIGDGTLGEGVLYECLNIASLWSVPVLFACENNGYAQTTPIGIGVAGSIARRAEAFGMETVELDTTDPLVIGEALAAPVRGMRGRPHPVFAVLHTYRFGPHSKGDDFRPAVEIAEARRKDPLDVVGSRLDPELRRALDEEAGRRLVQALARVREGG